MSKFVHAVLNKFINLDLTEKRVIFRRDNKPYLTRWYLVPRKRPSWCPGIYLHRFHAHDEDMELHDHPWKWAMAFILSGSYLEEIKISDDIDVRVQSAGNFNFIKGNSFHRIAHVSEDLWTIFISFNKCKDWGFWNRHSDKYINHIQFEKNIAFNQICETCQGTGEIDTSLGGIITSGIILCPDCDGFEDVVVDALNLNEEFYH